MSLKVPAWVVRTLYQGYPYVPGVTGWATVDGVPILISLFVGRIILISR